MTSSDYTSAFWNGTLVSHELTPFSFHDIADSLPKLQSPAGDPMAALDSFGFMNDDETMQPVLPGFNEEPMPAQHGDLERDLERVHQLTRTSAFSPLAPSGVSVYTMTIKIDPEDGLVGEHPNFIAKFTADEDRYMDALNRESKYKFVRNDNKKTKNSVILKTTRSSTGSTKVLKISNNAKIQMSGLKSREDVQAMVHLYKHLLKIVYSTHDILVGAPRVSVINGRFSTNTSLDLVELFAVCKERDQRVVMDLELHPAMMLKAGSGTVFVFSSGKVLIMGSKAPSDMTLGFNCIMNIIMQNHSRVHLV